jgi:hypothetical protein
MASMFFLSAKRLTCGVLVLERPKMPPLVSPSRQWCASCQKAVFYFSFISNCNQALMHSPEVGAWLQTHQTKRRRRKLHLPLPCRVRHRGSTDSHDSAQHLTVGGYEDPASGDDKSVDPDTALCRVASDNSRNLCVSSSTSPASLAAAPKNERVEAPQSAVLCSLTPVLDVGRFGMNDGAAATSAIRLSEVCGSGIWSKADSAFVSVIGAKISKSSA